MRLTQTTVVVLSYMKLLLIFQRTVNNIIDETIKKIVKFITWNYFSFDIIIWLCWTIIWVICITPSKDAISFSWKACKVYKCQYSFRFYHQSWIVGWWNFSLSQCVCNNFFQDICFLIAVLLEIHKWYLFYIR